MLKKRNRRPRWKRGWRYMAPDVRIEDAGPPPKGPIIGRHNPVRRAKILGGAETPPDAVATPPSSEN